MKKPAAEASFTLSSRPLLPIAVLLMTSLFFAGCSEEMTPSFMGKGDEGSAAQRFFKPTVDDIVKDEETGLEIVKDVINVNFSTKASEDTIKKIISSLNGEIVGYDKTVNLYQIRFKGKSLKEIDNIRMKLLSEYKEVEMASRLSVSAHKNPYYVK